MIEDSNRFVFIYICISFRGDKFEKKLQNAKMKYNSSTHKSIVADISIKQEIILDNTI